jgi:hypothetical protein
MSTRTRDNTLSDLKLPDPFEDLTGVISSDLRVIATALAQRAGDRLLLSPRQTHHLRRKLWNKLTQAINETMDPLTVERQ